MAIMKGTAPTHIFKLPFETGCIAKLRVNYTQKGELVVVKTEKDVVMNGNIVQIKLSQKETLSFCHKRDVEIQMDVLTKEGESIRSKILQVYVDRALNNEVLE